MIFSPFHKTDCQSRGGTLPANGIPMFVVVTVDNMLAMVVAVVHLL
jgi:hypothetical protein